jgi:mannose-6-phosphate isomerase
VGLDGKPRAMHIEQSMTSLEANTAPTPKLVRSTAKMVILAECPEFRILRHQLARGETLAFKGGQACLVSVTQGQLSVGETNLERGSNVLVPYTGDFSFVAKEDSTVLVTDSFSSLEKAKA